MLTQLKLWRDARGRLSALRVCALVLLLLPIALAVTSTDGMVRRLGGRRWQRLHQLIYVIVLLALIHFFQQTKLNVWWPTLIAGLVGWLLGYRIMVRGRSGEPSALMLLGLTVA